MPCGTVANTTVSDSTVTMTPLQRKAAFQSAATIAGLTLEAAANKRCGVTWFHLSEGLKGKAHRPLSDEVKTRFAAFVGRSVEELFGESTPEPRRRRRRRAA